MATKEEPKTILVPSVALELPLRFMEGKTNYRSQAWFLNDANGVNIATTYDADKAARLEALAKLVNGERESRLDAIETRLETLEARL